MLAALEYQHIVAVKNAKIQRCEKYFNCFVCFLLFYFAKNLKKNRLWKILHIM
jgi:hypothetical protein